MFYIVYCTQKPINYRINQLNMNKLLLFAVLIMTLASCSPRLTPFTASLRNEYQWTDDDLKKIQFYLSEEVVLWREVRDGDAKIKDGAIKVRDGKKVEEIRFPKRTPCVYLFEPKSNRFAMGFESGEGKYLMFGPSKRRGSDFVLLAADWKKDIGKISYDNKIFFTTDDSAYSRLLVDLRAAQKLTVKRKTVEGRTIDD